MNKAIQGVDRVRAGFDRGWQHTDASRLNRSLSLEADVVIVGSGAGGGVAAEILAKAGLKVIVVEEGPLKTSSDFSLKEADAYPELYQESAARKTADKGIMILQGRAVGGSTLVNWTTCFRTPTSTLDWWQQRLGLEAMSAAELDPWFARMEKRLSISPWGMAPNANNSLLEKGAHKLGWSSARIARNVSGCQNLGYCDLGCPVDAKQSMLVTTIPAALDRGAHLISRVRAEQLVYQNNQVSALRCRAMHADGVQSLDRLVHIRARHYVIAGGAINSPALLLRSQLPDPHQLLGKRTFLHPVNLVASIMPEPVDAFRGAPQSVYSDHFNHASDPSAAGQFKIEAPPVHPLITASVLSGFGKFHADMMRKFRYLHVTLALQKDGFHSQSRGGEVKLRGDGSPELKYSLGQYHAEGFQKSYRAMCELHFAAGATQVMPLHELARPYSSWRQAKKEIATWFCLPPKAKIVSAHVMGGCAMGRDESQGVVNTQGRHWQLSNLSILDGSVFPTSIGANPQLSVYAWVARAASILAEEMSI